MILVKSSMRRLASLGTMIVLFGGIRLYRSQESGNPQITVAKPERRGREASVVHYTLTNQARLSILLPTFVLGDALYTLDIEHEVPGKGWVALPRHREHIESSYSNPLSVAPGEAYHADLVLPDRMEVSRWVALPHPPHTIIMRGKFRLRLAYFLGEA